MGRALPQDGQRTQRELLLCRGLQVFHRQDVVGPAQQQGLLPQALRQHQLPGCGKGEIALPCHKLPDLLQRVLFQKGQGQLPQGRGLPGLAAKAQMGGAESAQQAHGSPGKALRRGQGPGQGQLDHQVRAAAAGRLRPDKLIIHRGLAPLHKVPGQHAEHRALPLQGGAAALQVQQMPPVEGIVFTDHADHVHWLSPEKRLAFFPKCIRITR